MRQLWSITNAVIWAESHAPQYPEEPGNFLAPDD